jgi:tetratricopeptide (TPR) repeat protein
LFAVHPVNVATVAWISEQKSTLSMLFFALSILWYLRFDEDNEGCWYGLSLAAFSLALLSKAAVVMLPVVLLGCVWWLRGRLRSRDWLRTAPFFALSILLGLTTVWFQYHRAMNGWAVRSSGLVSRLAVAGLAPWFYLYKAVLPLDLCMVYPQWNPEVWGWSGSLPGLALVGGFALLWWKRNGWGRPLLFGFGYFVVMLFPVLGFFDQGFYQYSMVADHWQYYSIAGVTALAAAGAVALGPRLQRGQQQVIRLVAGVVVIVLGAMSWQRCLVFRNQETLFRNDLLHNPLPWVAHNYLGLAVIKQGRMQEGIAHFEDALRIRPDFAEAHNDLGNALLQVGKNQEAIRHYEQALRISPDYPEAHNDLGIALAQAGRIPEAIEHWEHALRVKPDFADAHFNLGLALEETGRTREAIEQLEQSLKLRPDFAPARNALARLQARQ